jgi:hypothetical protein
VKTTFVEEDVMFVVVLLQQLARHSCALAPNARNVECSLMRGIELDLGCSSHASSPGTCAYFVRIQGLETV